MFHRSTISLVLILACAPLFSGGQGVRAGEPEDSLYKAYFLEHKNKDFAEARTLYEKVLSAKPDDATRRAAKSGAGRCRDHIAAQNFAKIMPENALAYVEINQPGELLHQIAGMLGLTNRDMQEALSQRPNQSSLATFHLPSEITISPSLFEYLTGFGGAAVAITGIDTTQGKPSSGVAVIHHGDATLMKGLLETAFQFAPTAEKVRDLPTFGSVVPELGNVTGVLTESLLIVATDRDLIEGVVDRLIGEKKGSLADRSDLDDYNKLHTGATLLAFADLQRIIQIAKKSMSQDDQREFNTVNAIADLDSLRWAAFSLGAHDSTLGAQLVVRLADEHHNIVYNFMRLPPMSQECLSRVPAGAAGVFSMGLNPALAQAALDAAERQNNHPAITAFDIGREFFGNIRSFAGFVLPGEMIRGEIPNFGVVLAVNDIARSRALWDQMLSLPGLANEGEPKHPREMKIGDTPVRVYDMPEFGPVYLTELDGCLTIGISRSVIKAAIRAHTKKESILNDPIMSPALARLPKDVSIMAMVNAGRMANLAAGTMEAGEAFAAKSAGELCKNTVGWFALGQAPSRLTINFAVTGLPNVNDAIKRFAPTMNDVAGQTIKRPDVVVEKSKDEERVVPGL